jgi:hypothetical protein
MFFPFVAQFDPRGPWCEQFWIYIISESFHVNMSYSDTVVLEKKIFKLPHPIFQFCNHLPFEEDLALYLNNSESHLPKDDLHQVWLKLASWFWRGRFLNILVYFYFFAIISPWAWAFPFIWIICNLLLLRMICANCGQNWSSGSGEEVENVKVYRQMDRQKDDGQRAIRIAHLSFQLRWANKGGRGSHKKNTPNNLHIYFVTLNMHIVNLMSLMN